MWDLAISDYGDLILAGNRDLAGVSGEDLISQRITTRLLVHRGSWFYDTEGTFGSDLYQSIGKTPQQDLEIDARVRDALTAMDDIVVEDVDWRYADDGKSVVVRVEYSESTKPDESFETPTEFATVTVPVVSEGGF